MCLVSTPKLPDPVQARAPFKMPTRGRADAQQRDRISREYGSMSNVVNSGNSRAPRAILGGGQGQSTVLGRGAS